MDFCEKGKLSFFNRRVVSFIMALIIALSSVNVYAFAEETPDEGTLPPVVLDDGGAGDEDDPPEDPSTPPEETATPDPTDVPSAPFEKTYTMDDGVRFVITAPAGVIIPGKEIFVEREKVEEELENAILKTLEIVKNDYTVIQHKMYLSSGASLNGEAKVRIEKLGLTDLQKSYPGSSISVFVLRCNLDEPVPADRIKKLQRDLDLENNLLQFFVTSLGLFDVVTVIRLPEPTATPEPTEEPTPEPTAEPTVEPTVEPTAEPAEAPTLTSTDAPAAPEASLADEGSSSLVMILLAVFGLAALGLAVALVVVLSKRKR